MDVFGGDRQHELLDALAGLEADAARLFARRVDLLVELTAAADATERVSGHEQFTSLELAGTCRLGQGAADRHLTEAGRWSECLPLTLGLLRSGQLLVHQAQVLFETTRHCPVPVCNRVEQQVLAHVAADPAGIAGWCPADLRKQATRTVLSVAAEQGPAAVRDREAAARAARRVWARPDLDGMGIAGALLPLEQLAGWSRDLDTLALAERTADRAAGITRTADQRRADLFAALPAMVLALRAEELTGAAPGVSARPVRVLLNVHVPMDTVLDLTHTPGRIDSGGAATGQLSAEHVRRLVPTAALRRIAVDATTGQPIAIDTRIVPAPSTAAPSTVAARTATETRTALLAMITPVTVVDRAEPRHDPSASLARLVDLRDQRCSGPGCGAPAGRTDRDHQQPWPAGPTAAWNLTLRSRRCHRAKHTCWHPEDHPDGSATWTSPLGRVYRRPAPHCPPTRLPDHIALPPPRDAWAPAPTGPEHDHDDDTPTWPEAAPATQATEDEVRRRDADDPPPF